jgi:hypothetical protein
VFRFLGTGFSPSAGVARQGTERFFPGAARFLLPRDYRFICGNRFFRLDLAFDLVDDTRVVQGNKIKEICWPQPSIACRDRRIKESLRPEAGFFLEPR